MKLLIHIIELCFSNCWQSHSWYSDYRKKPFRAIDWIRWSSWNIDGIKMRIICREDSWYSTERVTWVVKSLSVRLCLSVERDRYRPPVFANITAPNTILATNSAFWPISLLESCPHNTNNLNYRYPFVTSLLSFWLGVQKRVVVPAKKVNHLSSSIMFELLSISPSSVLELDSVPSSSTCSSDIFGTKAWGGCDPRICFVLFSFLFLGGGGAMPPTPPCYAPYANDIYSAWVTWFCTTRGRNSFSLNSLVDLAIHLIRGKVYFPKKKVL